MNEDNIYIVAEIGINHNGSLERAIELIDGAHKAGADAVKFQKRTIDIVYTEEELARPRESVFGNTNGDLKRGLEFGEDEYDAIAKHCEILGIDWYASPWDTESVDFLAKYDIPYLKIASASITDKLLLQYAIKFRPLLLSTGMCNMDIVSKAIEACFQSSRERGIACLYHCVSTYPAEVDDLNLRAIQTLQQFAIPVGYSGHEVGIVTSVLACALGAVSIERHVTLSRADWGSDQAASLDMAGFSRLCRDIRIWERARGDGFKEILDDEWPIIEKLRRVDSFSGKR